MKQFALFGFFPTKTAICYRSPLEADRRLSRLGPILLRPILAEIKNGEEPPQFFIRTVAKKPVYYRIWRNMRR